MSPLSWGPSGLAALLLCLCCAASGQTLRAGGTDWPPYSFLDAQGQPRGISVDVAERVMAQSGQRLKFLFYPAKRLNLLLQRDQLDLNYADSPLWNTPSDDRHFVYTQPYLHVREYLYFLDEHPAHQATLTQLQGLRIGEVRGYNYPVLTPAYAEHSLERVETSDDDALIDLLLAGRVDAIAMVDDVFARLVAKRDLPRSTFARGAQLSDAPLVIKLQSRYAAALPELNASLANMVDSGEVERIRRSYLGVLSAQSALP